MAQFLGNFTQQLGEYIDYDIDASDFLPAGDDLASAEILSVTPTGPTATAFVSGQLAKVWLDTRTGAVNGTKYTIEVCLTSNDGRIKEAEFTVRAKET